MREAVGDYSVSIMRQCPAVAHVAVDDIRDIIGLVAWLRRSEIVSDGGSIGEFTYDLQIIGK